MVEIVPEVRQGKLGDLLYETEREMFRAKSCRTRDAIQLLNLWGPKKSLEKIDRLLPLMRVDVKVLQEKISAAINRCQ